MYILITKLKTTNLGNQALSGELISALKKRTTNFIVRGRPFGLEGYYKSRLTIHNLTAKFNSWAQKIADIKVSEVEIDFSSNSNIEVLKFRNKTSSTIERFKAKLRPLKRFLLSFFLIDRNYKNRLSTIKQCDWVIYSGAGEVGDNNVFLRQLLELKIAQLLNKKTAAINQSIVVKTLLFSKLCGMVYSNLDLIIVRGEESKSNLIKFGVDKQKIQIAPDSAFLTQLISFQKKQNIVGINLTPNISFNRSKVIELVNDIRKHNIEVVFVTNEPLEDLEIAKWFKHEMKVDWVNNFDSYIDYANYLSSLKFLISTRLHSNVLALIAHTPVIPIEGNVFKTSELLNTAMYPIKVLNTNVDRWEDELSNLVSSMLDNKIDLNSYFADVLPLIKEKALKNVEWIN